MPLSIGGVTQKLRLSDTACFNFSCTVTISFNVWSRNQNGFCTSKRPSKCSALISSKSWNLDLLAYGPYPERLELCSFLSIKVFLIKPITHPVLRPHLFYWLNMKYVRLLLPSRTLPLFTNDCHNPFFN